MLRPLTNQYCRSGWLRLNVGRPIQPDSAMPSPRVRRKRTGRQRPHRTVAQYAAGVMPRRTAAERFSAVRRLWVSVNAISGLRQRQSTHPFLDMPVLGSLRSKKTATRRRVVEQIVHFDRRSLRMCGRRRRADVATIRFDLPGRIGFQGPRRQAESCDRRDTRQCLAAKSQ